jgi:hypothetical protein
VVELPPWGRTGCVRVVTSRCLGWIGDIEAPILFVQINYWGTDAPDHPGEQAEPIKELRIVLVRGQSGDDRRRSPNSGWDRLLWSMEIHHRS